MNFYVHKCDLDKLLGYGSGVFGGHGATGLERVQGGPNAHQHGVETS